MENFEKIECVNCGVLFAISSTFKNSLKENKQSFHCPNGHSMSYKKSNSEYLQELLDKQKRITVDKDIRHTNEVYLLNKEIKKLKRQKK